MAYFPLFVDIRGKDVLVAGGGAVAARRVESLLSFGARVTVVAPEIDGKIETLLRPVSYTHLTLPTNSLV